MTYTITNRQGNKYLSFDDKGYHNWSTDYLDAIRFDNINDIYDSCEPFLKMGAKIKNCGDNGKYQHYRDYEVQTYKMDGKNDKWTFRFSRICYPPHYHFGREQGYASQILAFMAATQKIDSLILSECVTLKIVR